MPGTADITPILEFLPCRTPDAWIREAVKPENLEILLIDHANNELKAANNALSIIRQYGHASSRKVSRYVSADSSNLDLLNRMSRLAREELRHFEQVLALMNKRGIPYRPVSASRYASRLRQAVRTPEPARLADTLIIGAFIEARSCERFHVLAPYLDTALQTFYCSLLTSESRHFRDYLTLAEGAGREPLDERIAVIAAIEQEAIESSDTEFRFHSGVPASASGL